MTCRSIIASTALSFNLIFNLAAPAGACFPTLGEFYTRELQAEEERMRERRTKLSMNRETEAHFTFLEKRINKLSELLARLEELAPAAAGAAQPQPIILRNNCVDLRILLEEIQGPPEELEPLVSRFEYWRIDADDLAVFDDHIEERRGDPDHLRSLAAALKCQRAIDARTLPEVVEIKRQETALEAKLDEAWEKATNAWNVRRGRVIVPELPASLD